MMQPKNSHQLNRRLIIQITFTFVLLVLISLSGYRAFSNFAYPPPDSGTGIEDLRSIQVIPMAGEIHKNKAEISGMAWFGDLLVLLPQYPHRFGNGLYGRLYALSKTDILAFLDGTTTTPLQPIVISFDDSKLFKEQIQGFEGFEAIAFNGEQVYLTVEVSDPMRGYLATGTIDSDLNLITMNPDMVNIPLPLQIKNFADEALIVFQEKIYTFYEANGINLDPDPIVQTFDLKLGYLNTLPLTNIEYRLTDASAPDANGYFWVVNYFFLGDLLKLKPGPDQVSKESDNKKQLTRPIERLVELKVTDNGIELGTHAPIRIALADNGLPRNWEALARLDERGFLIATDSYPETMLAFIGQ